MRMDIANAKLTEGRNFALLGGLGANMTAEMRCAIASARKTVRFLTHLCVGHCVQFQDILREQPMYNVRTYDLVSMCSDLLCSMADSQQAVKYMSGDELDLLRDLLVFLYQAQEGPNPDNQLKVASSGVSLVNTKQFH
jgi:hypothetical protein